MRPAPDKHRFLLRLDASLYHQLLQLPKTQGLSVNTLCSTLIDQGLREIAPKPKWIEAVAAAYESENLQAIVLFGSRSRGDATPSSDLDLLLVFPTGTRITRSLYRKQEELESLFAPGIELSFHCAALPQDRNELSGLWFEVALDGKILWKKTDSITLWLDRVKEALCSGKYVRKLSSGQPYWMKNEK